MSFKVEVRAKGESSWHANALRFRSKAEAERYQSDLYSRWMMMEAGRVARSSDPVNATADQYGRVTHMGSSRRRHGAGPTGIKARWAEVKAAEAAGHPMKHPRAFVFGASTPKRRR